MSLFDFPHNCAAKAMAIRLNAVRRMQQMLRQDIDIQRALLL